MLVLAEGTPLIKVDGTSPQYVKGRTNQPVVFSQYYDNEEFSDVKLLVGNRVFHGHKIILSAASEVFQSMFSAAWNPDSSNKTITLEESPQMEEVFAEFLAFMYSWKITFTEENVIPLMLLADKYLVPDLITVGVEYMISTMSYETLLPWYKFSLQFQINDLYQKCMKEISHNFENLCEKKKLLPLEMNELTPILDSGAIIATSEMKIVDLILEWVQYFDRADSPTVLQDMERLLKFVRFPMMSPEELDQVEKIPALRDILPQILPMMYCAYKFHNLGHEVLLKTDVMKDGQNTKYLVPRIYTSAYSTDITPTTDEKMFTTPTYLSAYKRQNIDIKLTYVKGRNYISMVNPKSSNTMRSYRLVVISDLKDHLARQVLEDKVISVMDNYSDMRLDISRFLPLQSKLRICVIPQEL